MPADISSAIAVIGHHVRFEGDKDKNKNLDDNEVVSDWEYLPDLPSSDELLTYASPTDLPWFVIDHKWESKKQYLEALYKTLRFEGVEGLRFSIRTFRERPIMGDDDDTCIYTKVRVQGYLFAKLGPIARISFSTTRGGVKIKWKQSKRLQPGKIVALSNDLFKSDCRVAIVAQRPIEGGLDQNPPVVDLIWADPAEAALIDPDQEFVMLESRNGYYEAVRHALNGLQHAALEWSPLDKYVVKLDRSDLAYPTVLTKINYSSLVDHLTTDQLSGDKPAEQQAFREIEDRFKEMPRKAARNLEALKPYTSLDDSQLEALERIVTKEVAIVQGPPGTGKTFTSVKSILAIMKNRQPGDPPIVVSAQTNHALDQILIYCKSAGANIMRVGGRTDNDEIALRSMFELRVSAKLGGPGKHIEAQRNKIVARFEGLVNGVFGGDGLLDPQALLDAGVITNTQYKSFIDDEWEGNEDVPAMEAWLGAEKIDRIRQQMEDFEFDEFEVADEAEVDLNLEDDQVDEEEDRIYGRWVPLSSQHTGRKPQIASWEIRCRALLGKHDNLYDIPRSYRGGVYQVMELMLREATSAQLRDLINDAAKQALDHKAACWIRDLSIIDRHSIDIVGCTTTGLTKYRGFLAAFQPRVLLIEEAAETREANVASALFPSVQQLILVGDHQQLPPNCDVARLADPPYNLNVSLFERLVENNLPYTMLNRQRRMAPELRYILQKFYPNLQDHPLVEDIAERPFVPGLGARRSWFFTHNWPEDTDADNSKFNQTEVEVVVAFIRYLLHNNVKASEITILTYYRGQKRKLLQRLRHKDIPIGNYFNVATVDSYQGQENEIVILSLVRNPGPSSDYRVGFLESRNRATVAISRARRGFFMFGNKENILGATEKSFMTWAPVWNGFADQKRVAMSKGLPLVCQNHGNEIWIKDADDLVGNAGGCWEKCDGELLCGHACVLKCHNITHDKLPCLQPCADTLVCGHKCAGYCSDPCRCAVNCPEYVRIRLELQLDAARAQAEVTRSKVQDARVPSSEGETLVPRPQTRAVARQGDTPSSNDWQDLANNPEAYDEAIRAEGRKIMGDARVAEVTLQRAFDNIQETFIEVTDQDGRRIAGAEQQTDIHEESRLNQQLTAKGLDKGLPQAGDARASSDDQPSPSRRSARSGTSAEDDGGFTVVTRTRQKGHVSGGFDSTRQSGGNSLSRVQGRPVSAGRPATPAQRTNGSTVNRRGGQQNGRGENRGNHGVYRGTGMPAFMRPRPSPINVQSANGNGTTRRERSTGHTIGQGNNTTSQTVRSTLQLDGNGVAQLAAMYQQDDNPDSASLIGDMGFEDELQEATRPMRVLNIWEQQPQALRIFTQRGQTAQAESLINFGDDAASTGVMPVSDTAVNDKADDKQEDLLIDF